MKTEEVQSSIMNINNRSSVTETDTDYDNIVEITNYDSVIVPSTMRSLYWKYFGFPGDSYNNIITKKKIVCVLCSGIIAYNKNTTNLRTHLVAKHSDSLYEINNEIKQAKLSKRTTVASTRGQKAVTNKRARLSQFSESRIIDDKQGLVMNTATATAAAINNTITMDGNDGDGTSSASTITIIHNHPMTNDLIGDKTNKLENLQHLKLPLSIIEALQEADDDDDDDDDDNCGSSHLLEDGDLQQQQQRTHTTATTSTSNTTAATTARDDNIKREATTAIEKVDLETLTSAQHHNHQHHDGTELFIEENDDDSNNRNDEISIIVEMCIKDLLPVTTFNGIGFQEFTNNLNRNYVIPQRCQIERNLYKLYEEKFHKFDNLLKTQICTINQVHHQQKQQQQQQQQHQQYFSISMEIWRNIEQKLLLSVYFNYYDNNAATTTKQEQLLRNQQQQTDEFLETESLINSSSPAPSPTLLNAFYKTIQLKENTNELSKLFDGIDMKYCTAAIVNAQNDVVNEFLMQYEIPIVLCFGTVINLCLEKVLNLPNIKNILSEVLKLIEMRWDAAENYQLLNCCEENPWSKLNLFNIFYENSSWTDVDTNNLLMKVQMVKETLLPLRTTIETLTDEPVAFNSLVRPFTTKLLEEHFSACEDDKVLVIEIKTLISKELRKHITTNSYYVESAFFDPRFISFIDTQEIQQVKQNLSEKFREEKKLQEKFKSSSSSSTASDTSRRSSLKQFFKPSERSLSSTGNGTVAAANARTSFDSEISNYISETNGIDLEQCPMTWWNEYGYVCRQMKKIAQKYFCVPSCCTNIFKLNLQEQIHIQERRKMLKWHQLNQLWFLHYNKNLEL